MRAFLKRTKFVKKRVSLKQTFLAWQQELKK